MGYARDVLERRRNLEMELDAIRAQMDKITPFGEIRGSWPQPTPYAKLANGNTLNCFMPRGTNNPEGLAVQHADGYEEALREHAAKNNGLMVEAEYVIVQADDSIDRTILRHYYCNGMDDQSVASRVHIERSAVTRRRNQTLDNLDEKLHTGTHGNT